MTPKVIIRSLVMIGLLVALGFLLKSSGLGEIIDKDWIDVHIRNNGLEGQLLYLGAASILVAAGVPRQIVFFLGVYAVGLHF